MPPCLVCDRKFANRDALIQHLATSSAWHPFCETCNRRFISKEACDGHMLAKHPPTFPCTICQRTFTAPFALDDHYRGSSAHPNCVKCGKGFRDVIGHEEHRKSAHPPCARCQDRSVCEETIGEHYLLSANHPSCITCKVGFKDEASELQHGFSVHPERTCTSCQETFESIDAIKDHYLVSTRHKKCFTCNIGFQKDTDHLEHVQRIHLHMSEVSKNENVEFSSSTTAARVYDRPAVVPRSRIFPNAGLDSGMAWRSLADKRSLPPPGRAVNAWWEAQKNRDTASSPPTCRVPVDILKQNVARTGLAGLTLGWTPGRK